MSDADPLTELADFVKQKTIETCAKIAEIQARTANPSIALDEYITEGYNLAVKDIAAKIRRLK